MTHLRRHPLIWLALAAMLALALLPTVSRAMAHARAGAAVWAEICTPKGLRAVTLATADRGAAPLEATDHWANCPLCTLAADHPGLPPTSMHASVLLRVSDVRPPPAAQPCRSLPGWRHAQPRGPPGAA